MNNSRNTQKTAPIVSEELFPAPTRKPLDHKEARAAGVLAIERVGLTARPDATGEDRLTALESLALLAWQVSWCQDGLVQQLRNEGATWQAIGDALGVTRSAAHQRFSS